MKVFELLNILDRDELHQKEVILGGTILSISSGDRRFNSEIYAPCTDVHINREDQNEEHVILVFD